MGPPLISGGNAYAAHYGRLTYARFNGAAADQRRKSIVTSRTGPAVLVLQWGRR